MYVIFTYGYEVMSEYNNRKESEPAREKECRWDLKNQTPGGVTDSLFRIKKTSCLFSSNSHLVMPTSGFHTHLQSLPSHSRSATVEHTATL